MCEPEKAGVIASACYCAVSAIGGSYARLLLRTPVGWFCSFALSPHFRLLFLSQCGDVVCAAKEWTTVAWFLCCPNLGMIGLMPDGCMVGHL